MQNAEILAENNKQEWSSCRGDIVSTLRGPVYAMLPGQVIKVGEDKRSGIYVTLRHGDFTVSYCHHYAVTVRKGDCVLVGSTVVCSGNSGRSTGPHTHLTCKLRG